MAVEHTLDRLGPRTPEQKPVLVCQSRVLIPVSQHLLPCWMPVHIAAHHSVLHLRRVWIEGTVAVWPFNVSEVHSEHDYRFNPRQGGCTVSVLQKGVSVYKKGNLHTAYTQLYLLRFDCTILHVLQRRSLPS